MTAEVAILNNQGVAIAADNAVTIGLNCGEKKIYYTAGKIFNVSQKHHIKPISLMYWLKIRRNYLMKNCLFVPAAIFAADDATARKMKEIAEKLKNNQDVSITRSGEMVTPNDPKAANDTTLTAPAGKLASPSFYWYERDPSLYNDECNVMRAYFPQFQLDKLDDGRLCWYGALNPRGKDGGVWNIMAIYDNNHPNNNNQYGSSVRVYSINPDLDVLDRQLRQVRQHKPEGMQGLPHLLRDGNNSLYMCTARQEDVDAGVYRATSAAKSIGWAVKWIWMVEGLLHGDLGDEVYGHGTF